MPTDSNYVREVDDFLEWSRVAARTASGKLGKNTVLLDVGEVLIVSELFVITSANNVRHVRTLVEAIESEVSATGGPRPRCIEGLEACQWVLMDYGAFVVHVFDEERREYYDLERLWSDRPTLAWESL